MRKFKPDAGRSQLEIWDLLKNGISKLGASYAVQTDRKTYESPSNELTVKFRSDSTTRASVVLVTYAAVPVMVSV